MGSRVSLPVWTREMYLDSMRHLYQDHLRRNGELLAERNLKRSLAGSWNLKYEIMYEEVVNSKKRMRTKRTVQNEPIPRDESSLQNEPDHQPHSVRMILKFIEENGPVRPVDITESLKTPRRTVSRGLRRLLEKGLIRQTGSRYQANHFHAPRKPV